jgi:hypothetical protein
MQINYMILIIIFVSTMNSHVGVATHNDSRYVASANYYVDNGPHHTLPGYYGQESMSTINSSSFNFTSNIHHVYSYSSAINSQYVVPPQDMSMNERIDYGDANYSANYSPISYDVQYANRTKVLPTNSASYVNASVHNSASHVTNNYG